ncbi:MAG: DNA polymerase I [Christensenellaceae bacterium]|jgi:DNA polymerase-1
MEKRLIVIDGNSLIFRAFHALPPMHKRDGINTNAAYGFFTMLYNVLENYKPTHLAVAFDLKGPTFRVEMYEDYKGTRAKTPEELLAQFPLIKDALKDLGIAVLAKEGYEADDIIGTLTHAADKAGEFASYVFTGDRDALQLISEHTDVLLTKKGVSETELYDKAHLEEVYGLTAEQFIDLKGLMGDASDNIPGIRGVGEKTALKLLKEYGSIDGIYEHIDALPNNKMKEKIVAGEASARLSKELATIKKDVPIEISPTTLTFDGLQDEKLLEVLSFFEFHSLIKRWGLESQTKELSQVEEITIKSEVELTLLKKEIEAEKQLAICFFENHYYIAANEKKEYRVSAEKSLFTDQLDFLAVFAALMPYFEDETVTTLIHNAKVFMHTMHDAGYEIGAVDFDPMLAEYVLDPTQRDFSVEKLKMRYDGDGHAAALYTAQKRQMADIEKNELEIILYEIEMPLCHVLYDMETSGFKLDRAKLEQFSKEYAARIVDLTQEIYDLAGDDSFNIASTKQLGVILFEKLNLPVIKKTKTGYSTDAEVLEKLQDAHPIIEKITEYRTMTKLKSTYLDGLEKVMDPQTDKVHTTFSQTATATGRISSIEPNLQNIPVRSEFTSRIRSLFIPSAQENLIVAADYSQIELRVLAHISEDAHMIDAFNKGEDIHTRTAAEVFGVPQSEVTPEMRSNAKAVNFGIVYGISDFGLARNLGIPVFKAEEYITKYLQEFSGVSKYMKDIVASAKEQGYVKTLYGRIRYIGELRSSNYNQRMFGERVALNTPIQGTAADIIKIAMIRVEEKLEAEKLASQLISQVHDELIVDAKKEEVARVSEILKETMEGVIRLNVPLVANVAVGKTWAEAK